MNYFKDRLLVTIDGGKSDNYIMLQHANHKLKKAFKCSNTRSGFDQFDTLTNDYLKEHNLTQVTFGYEPTGTYIKPIAYYADQKGYELVQVNPKHTKRLKEVGDNSPNKTDSKDPLVIANVIKIGGALQALLPKGLYADLRHLVSEHERLTDDYTRSLNRIEALVAEYFPEYGMVMKGFKGKTSRKLLQKYLVPSEIAKAGVSRIHKFIRKKSRGRFGLDKAKQIVECAKSTIGVNHGLNSISFRVKLLLEQLELLINQKHEVLLRIKDLCQDIPNAKLIAAIPGMAWLSAATYLSETTNLNKFNKASQIENLAGLDLFEVSSGNKIGNKHISKRGRTLLRTTLYFAALRMIKKDGLYHEYYQSCLKRGKNKKVTIIAVCKKLNRMIFSMIKNQTPFDPNKLNHQRKIT